MKPDLDNANVGTSDMIRSEKQPNRRLLFLFPKRTPRWEEYTMNCSASDLLLYAVTDRAWLRGQTLHQQVEQALLGGATFIQLREKQLDDESFLREAVDIQALCRQYHVPFVINDNVDIALRMNADGVHVGQSDMEAGDVRALLGPDKILGVSAKTVEQAVLAQQQGADYLGVGAMFPTDSKSDASVIPMEVLRDICQAVTIPVVAIGGINARNIGQLAGSGIAGVAVISAIFAADDIQAATRDLKARIAHITGT